MMNKMSLTIHRVKIHAKIAYDKHEQQTPFDRVGDFAVSAASLSSSSRSC